MMGRAPRLLHAEFELNSRILPSLSSLHSYPFIREKKISSMEIFDQFCSFQHEYSSPTMCNQIFFFFLSKIRAALKNSFNIFSTLACESINVPSPNSSYGDIVGGGLKIVRKVRQFRRYFNSVR